MFGCAEARSPERDSIGTLAAVKDGRCYFVLPTGRASASTTPSTVVRTGNRILADKPKASVSPPCVAGAKLASGVPKLRMERLRVPAVSGERARRKVG